MTELITIGILCGASCFGLGWLMRGKSAVVDVKLARDAGERAGYRRGLEAPVRAIKPVAK